MKKTTPQGQTAYIFMYPTCQHPQKPLPVWQSLPHLFWNDRQHLMPTHCFFFLSNILAMPFLINAPCQSEFFSWLGNCWYFADQTNYTVVSLVRANYNLWRVTIWLLTVINQTIFLNHMAVFIQWEY